MADNTDYCKLCKNVENIVIVFLYKQIFFYLETKNYLQKNKYLEFEMSSYFFFF